MKVVPGTRLSLELAGAIAAIAITFSFWWSIRPKICKGTTIEVSVVDACGAPLAADLELVNKSLGFTWSGTEPGGTFDIADPANYYSAEVTITTACGPQMTVYDVSNSCADQSIEALGYDYVWPLGNSCTADEMTTSFGPRINGHQWDFHDGIDLPESAGSPVYAVQSGSVTLIDGYSATSSARVVVESCDPGTGATMHWNYIHVGTDAGTGLVVASGDTVERGQQISAVIDHALDPKASYDHLHIEVRESPGRQPHSVHPLGYLPYLDTANFVFNYPTTSPDTRFNRIDDLLAARIRFGATSRCEGDLLRIEAELECPGGTDKLSVDFNDKSTLNAGLHDDKQTQYSGDHLIYGDPGAVTGARIGVEGYQRSNMTHSSCTAALTRSTCPSSFSAADPFHDLHYGIVLRDVQENCVLRDARLLDVRGNVTSLAAPISFPMIAEELETVDLEPVGPSCVTTLPAGWSVDYDPDTTVTAIDTAGHSSSCGLQCTDDHSDAVYDTACIEWPLPYTSTAGLTDDRFEWAAKGWFQPRDMTMLAGDHIYFLFLRRNASGESTVGVGPHSDTYTSKIRVEDSDDCTHRSRDGTEVIATGIWREWGLHLTRIGTRTTTAVLFIDEDADNVLDEHVRTSFEGVDRQPEIIRTGIGFSSRGVTADVDADDIVVSDDVCEVLPGSSDYDC